MGAAVQLEASVKSFVSAAQRKMLIDGRWVAAASGKTFDTLNPATGEVLAKVAEGDAEDVDRAVKVARRVFDEGKWANSAPRERQQLLFRIADLIEQHAGELAQLET